MNLPAWRERADEGVRQHRRGAKVLQLCDSAGQPVAGRRVGISLYRHAFGFGTCISEGLLANPNADGDRYRAWIDRYSALAVDENHQKWYSTEITPGVEDYAGAERIAAWCAAHDLPLRGHCLLWENPRIVQDWIKQLSPAALEAAVRQRVTSVVSHFRGRLTCWDGINEMLDGTFFHDAVPGLRAMVYRLAREIEPDLPLFVNEYGILGGEEKFDRLLKLIAELQAQGAPISGIGLQEHACERLTTALIADGADPVNPERAHAYPLSPEVAFADLDRLATLGMPIHLTEVSCKHPDPAVRAEGLETLLRIAFGHPAVDACLLWGIWSRCHWLGGPAALYDDNWQPTLAGTRVEQLLGSEWHTELEATSDHQGEIHFDGFHGRYRCSISDQSADQSAELQVDLRSADRATLTLQASAGNRI